jgi:hypothetical protein
MNNMTTQETYKQALNDILNSKTQDVAVLRKIALIAFTQPIKDIANVQPMNWMQYESQKFEWYLYVNEVHIACLVNEDTEGKKWTLTDYDTDFAPIFGSGSMPEFDSLDEGKKYCEMRFLLWLKDASDILKEAISETAV